MGDWLGLGVIVVLIVLALVGMARLGTPREEMTPEEFEERARTGGHTRAGLFGLQQWLHPKAVKAIEVQQDLKAGYYNKKRVPGDGEDDEEEAESAAAGSRGGAANRRGGNVNSRAGEEDDDA
ncbi:MAG TPA: hypothetical protein VIP46_05280 [Pyrinomonadaceae bacterium]